LGDGGARELQRGHSAAKKVQNAILTFSFVFGIQQELFFEA
jgi:hypothetical protein